MVKVRRAKLKESLMYAEVYEVLNLLGDEYISKIPKEFYNFIDESRDKNALVHFDIDLPIESQNISQETIEFISLLNFKYWCNDAERAELQKVYDENDKKYQQSVEYDSKSIFNNIDRNTEEPRCEDNTKKLEISEVKNSFIDRIISRIKNLFSTNQ